MGQVFPKMLLAVLEQTKTMQKRYPMTQQKQAGKWGDITETEDAEQKKLGEEH